MGSCSPADSNGSFMSEVEIAPWLDLPPELLSPVAESLGIVDLLSFRGVCKQWRRAPTTASAEVECDPGSKPWLILYGDSEKCQLYNPNDGKAYIIDLPELKNATCLGSNQGWLLLFQEGSVFFYCPFSRARIDLPQFPHGEMSNHTGAFTGPPTLSDCMVSIINRCDPKTLEVNVIKRGETSWTKCTFERNESSFGIPIGGVFIDEEGIFYYYDNTEKILAFSPKKTEKETCVTYTIVRCEQKSKDSKSIPCYGVKKYFRHLAKRNWIQVENYTSISICGTVVREHVNSRLICNERVEQSDGSTKCEMRGIWIQPRFFQVPTTQSW